MAGYVKAFHDWVEQMSALDDAERGRLFVAILEYDRTGEPPKLEGNERFLFPVFKAQIDGDNKKTSEISAKKAEAGKAGGVAKAGKSKQNLANVAYATDATESVAEGSKAGKENEKDKEEKRSKREEIEKDKEYIPPLTPQRGDAGRKLKKGQVIKMTPSEDFERFWKAYPRRDGKQEAWRAWSNAEIDSTLTDKIIDHVNRRRNLWEWKKEGGQYIPHASTFINQRRWEDDLTGKPISDPKNKNAFTSYAQHNSGYSWDDIDAFSIDDIALNLDGEDG